MICCRCCVFCQLRAYDILLSAANLTKLGRIGDQEALKIRTTWPAVVSVHWQLGALSQQAVIIELARCLPVVLGDVRDSQRY